LARVEDPALFAPLGELDAISSIDPTPGGVAVSVRVPYADGVRQGQLAARIADTARDTGAGTVDVRFQVLDGDDLGALGERLRLIDRPEGGKPKEIAGRVISIASGKGGVGKSTVTVNLAVALAQAGHSVGVLDADVYGFSIPRMLGATEPPLVLGPTVVPAIAHGVRCVSMGFFVDEDRAIAWRGPMLHKMLDQFVNDVHWGMPEFLLLDMPPGTGDVALSVAQHLPGTELYVVTTPQPGAERVAQRAGALARDLRIPIRGVIENMSWFETPDGVRYELFGSGGGATLANALGVDLLAQIPLEPAVRAGADEGVPASAIDGAGPVADSFRALAEKVVFLGPARVFRSELRIS
ncbi:MAG: Mrp/NBP35 family ATP-binding protein, partial [Acidimicrobiales bacterium]